MNYNTKQINLVKNSEVENGNYPEDKLTFDELLNKIKNHEEIKQGTSVYFDMHDIEHFNGSVYLHDEFIHIPTNTKILVDYDEEYDTWSNTSILLPGMQENEAIWIGDDVEDCWYKASHADVTTGFEMNVFVEWT